MIITAFNEKSRNFTGHIMRGDIAVAEIQNNEVISCTHLAPLMIQRTKNYMVWLEKRSAEIERSNMRLIRKILGLPLRSRSESVAYVNGASVTDEFWTKPESSRLDYVDIAFKNDSFFKAALMGDANIFQLESDATPELTNIGSFDKGWKLEGGKWCLYKAGTSLEYFSELFTSFLALELGLSAVQYTMKDGYVTSPNFVQPGQCLELAESFVGENEDYLLNIEVFDNLGLLEEYLDIIFLDTIVRNPDRHTQNYGVLTATDGTIRMAPNFDNNMSLFARGIPDSLARKDVMVKSFKEVYPKYTKDYKLPCLTVTHIKKAFDKAMSEIDAPVQFDTVKDFCLNAYSRLN